MEAVLVRKPLLGARVSFTGRLAGMRHDEARALVEQLGGRFTPSISRQTTLLVVGMAGWPLAEDGGVSRKLRQAADINRRGGRVRVISESAFLKRIGRVDDGSEISKSYPADTICQITGLNGESLICLEALGLVSPADGLYDYQDLVSLQTIAALLKEGVQPERIAGSLHSLRAVLPGVDRPLSQLRIIAEHPRSLLLELDGRLRTVTGQMAFDFDGTAGEEESSVALQSCAPVDWLERGEQFEDQERYAEAEDAYRRAISESPESSAVAWFNLGNVLRALGRTAEAEEAFSTAVDHDSSLAPAYYNLADLQEERGDLEAAIANLQSALRADRDMADAHYNLADCLDRIGRPSEAAKHWRAYLRFDPAGEWADVAKERLALAKGVLVK